MQVLASDWRSLTVSGSRSRRQDMDRDQGTNGIGAEQPQVKDNKWEKGGGALERIMKSRVWRMS